MREKEKEEEEEEQEGEEEEEQEEKEEQEGEARPRNHRAAREREKGGEVECAEGPPRGAQGDQGTRAAFSGGGSSAHLCHLLGSAR